MCLCSVGYVFFISVAGGFFFTPLSFLDIFLYKFIVIMEELAIEGLCRRFKVDMSKAICNFFTCLTDYITLLFRSTVTLCNISFWGNDGNARHTVHLSFRWFYIFVLTHSHSEMFIFRDKGILVNSCSCDYVPEVVCVVHSMKPDLGIVLRLRN